MKQARRSGERGQAVLFIVMIMLTLLLFVGFAVDLGGMLVTRRIMQNACDAGALAGAVDLPSTSTAEASAKQFVESNLQASNIGWNSGYPQVNILNSNTEVQVLIQSNLLTMFWHYVQPSVNIYVQCIATAYSTYPGAICAYNNVDLQAGGTVKGDVSANNDILLESGAIVDGNVGANGSGNGSITLEASAKVAPGSSGQPGNATTAGTVVLQAGASVAGTITDDAPSENYCPGQASVASSFSCTATSSNPTLSGSNLTISASGSYSSITVLAGGTLTFVVPTGSTITVQTLTFDDQAGATVKIQGGGTVDLIAATSLTSEAGSVIGASSSGGFVTPDQLFLESCSTNTSGPGIELQAGGGLSGIVIDPYGQVEVQAGGNSTGDLIGYNIVLQAGSSALTGSAVALPITPILIQ
jgi:Flp pilus assembly protein TadG